VKFTTNRLNCVRVAGTQKRALPDKPEKLVRDKALADSYRREANGSADETRQQGDVVVVLERAVLHPQPRPIQSG